MPVAVNGETEIYYEVHGEGPPVLCIAPGGLRSEVDAWDRAAIDPRAFADEFQVIVMDQRNAGRSRGPFSIDPWAAARGDQLSVLDAAGIDRAHVVGCCIGGPYVVRLAHDAPERVGALVLEQPMGMTAENRAGWVGRCHEWVDEVCRARTDLVATDGHAAIDGMWADTGISSLPWDALAAIGAPTCVLPGVDEIHPPAVGHEIAARLSDATVIDPWKDPAHVGPATDAVRAFLRAHASAVAAGPGSFASGSDDAR